MGAWGGGAPRGLPLQRLQHRRESGDRSLAQSHLQAGLACKIVNKLLLLLLLHLVTSRDREEGPGKLRKRGVEGGL